MAKTTLLGPQRRRPTVTGVARGLGDRVALITAGWQENENDSPPRGLGRRALNLKVYARSERAFDRDRDLAQAHHDRQLELKRLQRLYRLRLDHAVAAWRALEALAGEGGTSTAAEEADAALESIRALDRHHLERVREIHGAFQARWNPAERAAVAQGRREIEAELERVDTVVVAGGHVAVLLNRLRLFDLAPSLATKSLVAWSAGAMVCASRIVLFHDSPPWGAGNAELLDHGLGLFPAVLPLPDPARRLRTSDPRRVSLLARRLAPFACVGLGGRSSVVFDGRSWSGRQALLLRPDGAVRQIGAVDSEELAP